MHEIAVRDLWPLLACHFLMQQVRFFVHRLQISIPYHQWFLVKTLLIWLGLRLIGELFHDLLLLVFLRQVFQEPLLHLLCLQGLRKQELFRLIQDEPHEHHLNRQQDVVSGLLVHPSFCP